MRRPRFFFHFLSLLLFFQAPVYAQKVLPTLHDYFEGTPYVSLEQAAQLLKGRLVWRGASEQVEFHLRGHSFRFFYHSPLVLVDGQRAMLERQTIKNPEGFWVPARFFADDAFYVLTHARLDLPAPKIVEVAKSVEPVKPAAVPTATPIKPAVSKKVIRRIVIDPGHGGKDPGAEGPRGVFEKNITLALSQETAELLREKDDYEVLMTRMDDTFIPLAERARLANHHEADLFISIHCNASTSSQLQGFEVYFLSEKSSDPRADAAARFENAPLALEGKSTPTPSQLDKVLRSLVKTANINESSEMGALVHQKLSRQIASEALGVKQASFYVLRGAEMPAVLIEVGFLSNAREEKMLTKAAYRHKIAVGILEAVEAYDLRKQRERR